MPTPNPLIANLLRVNPRKTDLIGVDSNPTPPNDQVYSLARGEPKTENQESSAPEKKSNDQPSTLPPNKCKTTTESSSSLDTKKLYEDFRRQDIAASRGPNGPPIYDTEGFELDPKLCARSCTRRKPSHAQMERFYAKCARGDEVKQRV